MPSVFDRRSENLLKKEIGKVQESIGQNKGMLSNGTHFINKMFVDLS